MAEQAKVNGLTTAGSFYGYDPIILLIAGTNVGTADTASTDAAADATATDAATDAATPGAHAAVSLDQT